jgi:hypothetical protein
MTDKAETMNRLRIRCFGGPKHGQVAEFHANRFKALDTTKITPHSYWGDSPSDTPITYPNLVLGEYTMQKFSKVLCKEISSPIKRPSLWHRFLIRLNLARQSEQEKRYCIGSRRGYLYVWNWDGKPFFVNTRVEDLIAWDQIEWRHALPHEEPHGYEATTMEPLQGEHQ